MTVSTMRLVGLLAFGRATRPCRSIAVVGCTVLGAFLAGCDELPRRHPVDVLSSAESHSPSSNAVPNLSLRTIESKLPRTTISGAAIGLYGHDHIPETSD